MHPSPPDSDAVERAWEAIRRFLIPPKGADPSELRTHMERESASLPLTSLTHEDKEMRFFLVSASLANRPWWSPGLTAPWPESFLDLAHPDGRRREAVLRLVDVRIEHPYAWGLALVRLNDWVPAVRAAACECLPGRARATSPEVLVQVLEAALRVSSQWHRMGEREQAVIHDLVALPGVAHSIFQSAKCATVGPAAVVVRQASRSPALDPFWPDLARHAIQPVVRAFASRTRLHHRASWVVGWESAPDPRSNARLRMRPVFAERPLAGEPAFLEALIDAANDRHRMVRQVAAEALAQATHRLSQDEWRVAQRLAADAHRSVSVPAQFVLDRRQKPEE